MCSAEGVEYPRVDYVFIRDKRLGEKQREQNILEQIMCVTERVEQPRVDYVFIRDRVEYPRVDYV